MVKTLLAILLLLGSLGLPAWSQPLYDNPGTNAFAQDAAGTVWALPNDGNVDGKLRRWLSGVWVIQTLPDASGFRPRALTRGGDGNVYALWQTANQTPSQARQCLVTVQHGIDAHALARFPGAVTQGTPFSILPAIYAGSDGDVWVLGYRPLLWHISSDGSIKTFPLKPEQYFNGDLTDNLYLDALDSSIDRAGRRWFWQNRGTNNWQPIGLRGVLIWDGKTLASHPTISQVPDRPFSIITPLDKNHVWLVTSGDDFRQQPPTHGALYQVDTSTLSAVIELPPQPGAFQNIIQIFQANGDWYIVEQEQPRQTETLWRKRAGRWLKLVDSLEAVGRYYQMDPRHPWLVEPTGVWFGVSHGAWWLPRNGQPAFLVNWRRGLTVFNLTGLFPLKDGSILAAGQQNAAQIPAMPQPIRPLPPGLVIDGMRAPKSLGLLLSDPRHHLWGTRTFYTGPCPLDEWDGKRWRTHLPPKSVSGVNGLYACDTLGRIWLTTSQWNPPTQPQPVEGRAIYDPARDTWTNYATVPEALQAASSLPGMAFLPYRNTYMPPVFSGDGRVTYNSNTYNAAVFLYDGHAWQHWEVHDILPGYPYGNPAGGPYFNRDSHLEIALNNQLWEWTSPSGWQQKGNQTAKKYEDPVPLGGPHGFWAYPVVDNLGRKWFDWQGTVYTAWHGLWAKQTELSGPGSPFSLGFGIEDVLPDPEGRLFFVTRPAGNYELIVWSSPPPVPKPMLSVVPTADDSVIVRIHTAIPSRLWFLWRLNGGEWKEPQKTNTVLLTALPHGDYRLEVQTLDNRLQASTPAVAVFSIRVAAGIQIARWVRALRHGTNDEREAAVAGLVKQPEAALPALLSARSGASEASRWWIEAAIQQITDRAPAAEEK